MKYISLAKQYDLVVGDTFEMFYRGVICLPNPYEYYILVRCDKGNPYPRYFTFTPTINDLGDYPLTISLIDNDGNVIDEASTVLHIVEPVKPEKQLNVLCVGDSITFNGVWPSEGFRRFTKNGGTPVGLGFTDSLRMIGTCQKEVEESIVGYEGYGSWTWKSYCTNDVVSMQSPVWIEVDGHNFDENDQHSVWKSENLEWVLESIEDKKLKFKRGERNFTPSPKIGDTFEHVRGGYHYDSIKVNKHYFEIGNPFWNSEKQDVDIKYYVEKNGFDKIDLIYICLTWNGLFKPYNTDFRHHIDYAKYLIRKMHEAYPKAHITLLGIQVCSVTGGIAANYGAKGPYSDTFGEITTAFNYNKCIEAMVNEDEFKDYVRYVDSKAQFDSEYNMPYIEKPVNVRSNVTEKIGTNGVHPNMNGYLQLGDVFYRALVRDIVDFKKKEEKICKIRKY